MGARAFNASAYPRVCETASCPGPPVSTTIVPVRSPVARTRAYVSGSVPGRRRAVERDADRATGGFLGAIDGHRERGRQGHRAEHERQPHWSTLSPIGSRLRRPGTAASAPGLPRRGARRPWRTPMSVGSHASRSPQRAHVHVGLGPGADPAQLVQAVERLAGERAQRVAAASRASRTRCRALRRSPRASGSMCVIGAARLAPAARPPPARAGRRGCAPRRP